MKKLLYTRGMVAIFTFFCISSVNAKNYEIASPDNVIKALIAETNDGNLSLAIIYNTTELLAPSPIGIAIEEVKGKKNNIKKASLKKDITETIEAPFHHTPKYEVRYNDLSLNLSNGISLELRAFNDGIAYRFLSDNKGLNTVEGETAEYILPDDPTVYLSYSTNIEKPMAMAFQNYYKPSKISKAAPLPAFLPVTVDYGNRIKMTILESNLESYPGMFITADSTSNSLNALFSPYPATTDFYPWRKQEYVTAGEKYIAKTTGPRSYPWRIFAITDDDTQMPVNNLVYSLASPSKLKDVSWIKPGKSAWEWWNDWGLRGVPFEAGINNETYKYFIDFAAHNGIEYVILDEGWYDPKSGDMLTTIPEIDLPMLTAYAEQKGVGLWLWTVFNVLDSQLEEACQNYSEMGIKGLKVDFLDRNDQQAVEMTYRIANAAAKNNLMLDLHGFYTPTGLNRTYPNVVNYESVFGMEEMKWSDPSVDMPEYEVTFPYIRMMAGSVDFTPGAMKNASKADWKPMYSNPMSQGTRAHHMANYVVQDSPFTMLADSPSNYLENKDCLDFITGIPTVFDETRVLDGTLGEYIVTLRKKGNYWFIGGQTDWNPRDYELDFSFLPSGSDFKVTIVKDGVNAVRQAQDYVIDTFTANSGSRETIHMAPGGGFVIKVCPLSF